MTTAKRFPLLPDLPTIAESGYPGFEALAWNGVLVPAGTPKPVIARLNAEINAILKQPDVVQKMNASGFDLIGGTPEDFGSAASSARRTSGRRSIKKLRRSRSTERPSASRTPSARQRR